MDNIINNFISIGGKYELIIIIFRIVLAVLFGGIIGHERGRHGSHAGLRTHILVCLGSAMTALTGEFVINSLGYAGDPFRIAAQVVSGIGFLGAGMIIVKNGNVITGLTTAAGMWATAAIGIALGFGFYSGALLVTLACFCTATFLTRIERRKKNSSHIYVELNDLSVSGKVCDEIREAFGGDCSLELMPPKSATQGHLGIFVVTSNADKIAEFRHELEQNESVAFTVIE